MQTYLNKNSFHEKIFRLRVNEETFNVNMKFFGLYFYLDFFKDVTMVKITCLSISDIDFSEYGRRLIENIKK